MDKTVDQLALKIKELEVRLNKLQRVFFSYHIATMKYLKDEMGADPKEFERYLDEAKKGFKELDDKITFLQLMKDFWPPKDKR